MTPLPTSMFRRNTAAQCFVLIPSNAGLRDSVQTECSLLVLAGKRVPRHLRGGTKSLLDFVLQARTMMLQLCETFLTVSRFECSVLETQQTNCRRKLPTSTLLCCDVACVVPQRADDVLNSVAKVCERADASTGQGTSSC